MRIGIDPGKTGAIVVLADPGLAYVCHLLMPVMGVGKQTRVNGAALGAFFGQFVGTQPTINLESVHAMPGEAGRASFSFGHTCGKIEGVLEALGLPYNLITPQAWKKQSGLTGTVKDAARGRAIQLYPALRELDAIGKGQAIADAIFIAHYSRKEA